jgi:hypothetical protein
MDQHFHGGAPRTEGGHRQRQPGDVQPPSSSWEFLLKNLRLQKFDATFAMRSTTNRARFGSSLTSRTHDVSRDIPKLAFRELTGDADEPFGLLAHEFEVFKALGS